MNESHLFILKTRGTGKVPDHIQIRDHDFNLVAYFKITHPKTALARCNLLGYKDQILDAAGKLEYGKIQKLELKP